MRVVDPVYEAMAIRSIAVALWRQVARDAASRDHIRRDAAVDFLLSEQASLWAIRFDPDCDPDIVIQAVLAGGRHVRPTRHVEPRHLRQRAVV